MLTDAEIDEAKARTAYSLDGPHHEHNDCIRLAYEWFDAQQTIRSAPRRYLALKHIIEKWAGRYVSTSDVEVAAMLHPRISGRYPNYNISARLVRPNDRRLEGIGEALTHYYRDDIDESRYKIIEP